ncbi:Phage head morphogenesis domain-containing protein [Acinetobacter bereziniae]|uniref:Phage head morphogenesis domain-containing protein n=1 Tax=Acinetobacter bereziniae NIPH 3 TaxID=1217651 RepID=N8YNX7_ACIBZ|nr:hypothetical protein F963_03096 [Acinetobacter bereziniae NIPH 3]
MNDLEVQQAIIDALNQHNSYLQRLSSSSIHEILNHFDDLSLEMLKQLRDLLDDLNEAEKTTLTSGKYTTASLKEIQGVMTNWQQSISTILPEILDISMIALASYESAYIYKLANKKAPVISGKTLLNKAKKTPYAGGQLLDYIFPNVAESVRKKAEYVIRDGVSNGQTNQEIIQRIKGTKARNYADGLLNQTRNVIDAEVRTARAHLSNDVYLQTWSALGFEYTRDVATLDGRTSFGCAVKDGRVQLIGIGHEKPPYHHRCRTVQVGCDKDGKLDGTRPFVADNRPVKDIPKDQRDGKIGHVDANTTYKDWFDRQDESFQKEWLGPVKYKLYKEGGFPIDKFVDPLSGRKFTLDELRKVDEKGFESVFKLSKTGKSFKQPQNEPSFYDLPNKTQKPDVSTPARKKAVAYENDIRSENTEYGAFISQDGKIIKMIAGDTDKVSVSSDFWSKVAHSTFTHNHPKGSNFSIEDILTAAELNLAEVRVVTKNMRFAISSSKETNIWPSAKEIQNTVDELKPKALDITRNMINTDFINIRFAQHELEHQLWLMVAKRLNLNYSREMS